MRWLLVGMAVTLASPAVAQDRPTLDAAGVRGVRYLMREDAIRTAVEPRVDTMLDWGAAGVVRPTNVVTATPIRGAYERNAVVAERQFGQPFIVTGTLHSVSRRPDRQIVVQFVEGGAADSHRRALAGPGEPDLNSIIGGMTGGLMHAGAVAVLPIKHEDDVADWEPGSKVALHCRGASNVRLAVLLKGCTPQNAVIAEAEKLADEQSALALAGRPVTVPPTPERGDPADPALTTLKMLLYGYTSGLLARDCAEADTLAWLRCAQPKFSRSRPPARAAALTKQIARDLSLPESVAGAALPRPKSASPR